MLRRSWPTSRAEIVRAPSLSRAAPVSSNSGVTGRTEPLANITHQPFAVPAEWGTPISDIVPDINLTVSVVTALGAVAAAAVAWRAHQQDSARERANDLREALLQLIDLRRDAISLRREDPDFESVSSTLNEKRAILLAIAETLAERASGSLSAEDWITLGSESMAALNYGLAGKCFTRAVELASPDDAYTRAVALRELGQYYALTTTTDRGLEDADRSFGEAVDAISGITDSFGRFQTGLTYEMWAFTTASRLGEVDQQKIEAAFQCYKDAEAGGFPFAEDSIKALQSRLQSSAPDGAARENDLGEAPDPATSSQPDR